MEEKEKTIFKYLHLEECHSQMYYDIVSIRLVVPHIFYLSMAASLAKTSGENLTKKTALSFRGGSMDV